MPRGETKSLATKKVSAIQTWEWDDAYKVRTFENNWEVEFDIALLFKVVGKWLAENQKDVYVHTITYQHNGFTVIYKELPNRGDETAAAAESASLTVVSDAA